MKKKDGWHVFPENGAGGAFRVKNQEGILVLETCTGGTKDLLDPMAYDRNWSVIMEPNDAMKFAADLIKEAMLAKSHILEAVDD